MGSRSLLPHKNLRVRWKNSAKYSKFIKMKVCTQEVKDVTSENEMPRWSLSARLLLNVGKTGIEWSSFDTGGGTAKVAHPCPSSPDRDFLIFPELS